MKLKPGFFFLERSIAREIGVEGGTQRSKKLTVLVIKNSTSLNSTDIEIIMSMLKKFMTQNLQTRLNCGNSLNDKNYKSPQRRNNPSKAIAVKDNAYVVKSFVFPSL